MRRVAPVIAVVLALAGCGVERAQEPPPAASQAPAGGSAARAALRWWDGLGAGDAARVFGGLTPPARRSLDAEQTSSKIRGSFGHWAHDSAATVLYSERTGDEATVYLRIEAGDREGPVFIKRGTVMLALPFVSRAGEWKVDNSAWLRLQVELWTESDRLRKAKRAQDRASDQ
jgi:hypothetical protein